MTWAKAIGDTRANSSSEDGGSSGQEVFAQGFYDGNQVAGRPVDVLGLADGSLLVSDDMQGVLYRISYPE